MASARSSIVSFLNEAKIQVAVVCSLLLFMWIILIVEYVVPSVMSYGIQPRRSEGIPGILFCPFLHMNVGHLSANSVPFLVLGIFVAIRGLIEFAFVSCFIVVVGGFLVWLCGRSGTNHIGASGVIFGYFSYLLVIAFRERPIKVISLVITALVGVFYGGLLLAAFSFDEKVSWEGHLFGLLSGFCLAILFKAWAPYILYKRESSSPIDSSANLPNPPRPPAPTLPNYSETEKSPLTYSPQYADEENPFRQL